MFPWVGKGGDIFCEIFVWVRPGRSICLCHKFFLKLFY
jgi:hypothetical protein